MENIKIENGYLIVNGVALEIKSLAKKAGFTKDGNVKLKGIATKVRVWTYSTLFGCCDWYVPELNCTITGSCGTHCCGCFNPDNWKQSPCYVAKSYVRYTSKETGKCSPKYCHAKNTLLARWLPELLYQRLRDQLLRARKRPDIIRINQSGEIMGFTDFYIFTRLANEFNIPFWVYTKNYDVVVPSLLAGVVPSNMTILISVWHENGIEAYNKVKHLDNVKAFIYLDDFDYSSLINIDTYCKAYDRDGKMNHAVTCDICTKCFNRCKSHKCIGCYSH